MKVVFRSSKRPQVLIDIDNLMYSEEEISEIFLTEYEAKQISSYAGCSVYDYFKFVNPIPYNYSIGYDE